MYYYGANGVIGFRYNGVDYYYRKNLFGDVLAIYDSNGTVVAEYLYDAWGRVLAAIDKTDLVIANINPFRYRSYYYDTETGLYYLESRYYDPQTGRFINADSLDYLGDGEDLKNYNLFAYCENNPVKYKDPSGHVAAAIAIETIFDMFSLFLGIVDVLDNPKDAWRWIGLAGDIIDLLPTVSGVGESLKLSRLDDFDDFPNFRKDPVRRALEELDASGLRPGQTTISRSKIMDLVDNYNPIKAHSSIYTSKKGIRYLSDGHHTTVANTILKRGTEINMGMVAHDPPMEMNIYWTKKWYEFGKKAIKVVD